MKHTSLMRALIMGAAALSLPAFIGCKPSEKNYRDSYQTAIAARNNPDKEYLDDDALSRMKRGGRQLAEALPGGDTLKYEVLRARLVPPQQGDTLQLRRWVVITGRFKQIFNAREMRSRLASLGYDSAVVLTTSTGDYLVGGAMTDSPAQALESRRALESDTRLGLRSPFPWVLSPR